MTAVHLNGNYSAEDILSLEGLTGGKFSFTSGKLAGPVRCHVLVAGRVTEDQLAMCQGLRLVVVPYAGIPETTRRALEAIRRYALRAFTTTPYPPRRWPWP